MEIEIRNLAYNEHTKTSGSAISAGNRTRVDIREEKTDGSTSSPKEEADSDKQCSWVRQ